MRNLCRERNREANSVKSHIVVLSIYNIVGGFNGLKPLEKMKKNTASFKKANTLFLSAYERMYNFILFVLVTKSALCNIRKFTHSNSGNNKTW